MDPTINGTHLDRFNCGDCERIEPNDGERLLNLDDAKDEALRTNRLAAEE